MNDMLNSPQLSPLIGRKEVLETFGRTLDAVSTRGFKFLGLVGEPGVGKTRLLSELAAAAKERELQTLWGRAAEFEQQVPFGALVDALHDHLESGLKPLRDRLGANSISLLASVFPGLSAEFTEASVAAANGGGLARYQTYRAIRQLLAEVAKPSGLVLLLDDVHWADEATVELLEHLVRHPPCGRVLLAVAYRPLQVSPRLATLVEAVMHERRVPVEPLTQDEAAELLGPQVSRARCRMLYAATGGNPFYLEAVAHTEQMAGSASGGNTALRNVAAGTTEHIDVPPAVHAALQQELDVLSGTALLVARSGAVAGDEFEAAVVAVAAEVSEDAALRGLDEIVARDVVRPASGGRFRFRHPLVRQVAYVSAAAGWRLAAHARIANYLAVTGAPAAMRAHHVAHAAQFGDLTAVTTLVDAARSVAAQAPTTAAYWLKTALRLLPEQPDAKQPVTATEPRSAQPPSRLELLYELAQAQAVSGRAVEARETARILLRLLPAGAYVQRARVAEWCAVMERQLGRLHEAHAVVSTELRRLPDPQSPAAVNLRIRLAADRLMQSDPRGAQNILPLPSESGTDWGTDQALAITAMRSMAAYSELRMLEAIRHAEEADQIMAETADEQLAKCLYPLTFLCWAEVMVGRYDPALQHLDRCIEIARTTGQSFILPHMLAAQAQLLTILGRLAEAELVADEAAEIGRLLHSNAAVAFGLTQQCLIAIWSGDAAAALLFGEQAVQLDTGAREWWGAMARYARAMALLNSGRLDEGTAALLEAPGSGFPLLDPGTLVSCAETMAYLTALRGSSDDALTWADIAEEFGPADLPSVKGLVRLARAHAIRPSNSAAAGEMAAAAAEILLAAGRRLDAGRARLTAGTAYGEAGKHTLARKNLNAAERILAACGASGLHARAVREQRRLAARARGLRSGPYGLSRREQDVAALLCEGCTNQQIAARLVVSLRTVETHLSHIFAKLSVSSRVAAVTTLMRQTYPTSTQSRK